MGRKIERFTPTQAERLRSIFTEIHQTPTKWGTGEHAFLDRAREAHFVVVGSDQAEEDHAKQRLVEFYKRTHKELAKSGDLVRISPQGLWVMKSTTKVVPLPGSMDVDDGGVATWRALATGYGKALEKSDTERRNEIYASAMALLHRTLYVPHDLREPPRDPIEFATWLHKIADWSVVRATTEATRERFSREMHEWVVSNKRAAREHPGSYKWTKPPWKLVWLGSSMDDSQPKRPKDEEQ